MTVDHIVGNSQALKLNADNMVGTDLVGSKSAEQCEEENGVQKKSDEANGDLENGKLEIPLRDVDVTASLPRKFQESDDEDRGHEESDTEDKLKCGLGVLSPKWLQVFASKQAFLVTFCITWVLQGMYYTYFVSTITTIEKLFHIQSKTTGIIMSATEIGQIGSSLLLTYYGGQGHRPKWIGWGMVLFAVSSFMCALPHFLFGEQLIRANDILYSGLSANADLDNNEITSPNLCRSLFTDNYPPPMLMKDHLTFLKENPNYNIRNSFLILHSESQISHNLPSVTYNNYSNLDDSNNKIIDNKKNIADRKYASEMVRQESNLTYPKFPIVKQDNFKPDDCEEELLQEQRIHSKITTAVLTIFFISLLGVGMGQTAVYTLGIPYIDDNVAAKESPLYFGNRRIMYIFEFKKN